MSVAQDLRLQLQGWAAKRLGELNRDATASMIHNQLLKAAVRDRVGDRVRYGGLHIQACCWDHAGGQQLPCHRPSRTRLLSMPPAANAMQTYLRSKPEWWRLSVPRDDLPKAVKLAAGVYHLASSREGAWVSLERCMWHSMALSTRCAWALIGTPHVYLVQQHTELP